MDRSRILNLSTPDLLRAQAKGVVLEILAEPKRRALEILGALPDISEVESFGERLHATAPGIALGESKEAVGRVSEALTSQGVFVRYARAVPPTLEDLFIARMRAEETSHSAEVTR